MTDTNPRDLLIKHDELLVKLSDVLWNNGFNNAAREVDAAAERLYNFFAQPEPEGPTEEEIKDWHSRCADLTTLGEAEHYWAFDLHSDEVAGVVSAALARWGK